MGSKKKRLTYGVGLNDADYRVKYKDESGRWIHCPIYSKWANMLQRCYKIKEYNSRKDSYVKSFLCEDWKVFSKFSEWYRPRHKEGLCLDKDIMTCGEGNLYSPETCLLVPEYINNIFVGCGNFKTREYPLGLSWHTAGNKWQVFASSDVGGRDLYLGLYSDKYLAGSAYLTQKRKSLMYWLEKYKSDILFDMHVYNACLVYMDTIELSFETRFGKQP